MADPDALAIIEQAIRDYHLDLDRKVNVDAAERDCIRRIEIALDLPWFPRHELERRERIAAEMKPIDVTWVKERVG